MWHFSASVVLKALYVVCSTLAHWQQQNCHWGCLPDIGSSLGLSVLPNGTRVCGVTRARTTYPPCDQWTACCATAALYQCFACSGLWCLTHSCSTWIIYLVTAHNLSLLPSWGWHSWFCSEEHCLLVDFWCPKAAMTTSNFTLIPYQKIFEGVAYRSRTLVTTVCIGRPLWLLFVWRSWSRTEDVAS